MPHNRSRGLTGERFWLLRRVSENSFRKSSASTEAGIPLSREVLGLVVSLDPVASIFSGIPNGQIPNPPSDGGWSKHPVPDHPVEFVSWECAALFVLLIHNQFRAA